MNQGGSLLDSLLLGRKTTTPKIATKFRLAISECPAYATVRICIFGVPYISLQQIIEEYGISKLVEFINKSGRIDSSYFPT